MPPSLLPASASFAGLMYSFARKLNLRTPLQFLPTEVAGVRVQPSTGKVFICEQTLARVSHDTLAVVAAHEAAHVLECARLWRYLLARRSVGLAVVSITVATLGNMHVGQLFATAALLALSVERKVPSVLADARTEAFADAVACHHACASEGAWQEAVREYARAMGTPGDGMLRYRSRMIRELASKGALPRVVQWGPDILTDYETEEALTELGLGSHDPAPAGHSSPRSSPV